MDSSVIFPVILSGGAGTRLWPVSRKSLPKQFLSILGNKTLLQHAAERLLGPQFEAPVLVAAEPHRFVAAEQLEECGVRASAILLEPEPRNTAPAILAAAFWISKIEPDALMVVMPSDHQIPNVTNFHDAVTAAIGAAVEGNLMTFGVKPTSPETGYGYLELPPSANLGGIEPQKLENFVEKPDQSRAMEMLLSGRHLWNAGIFMFSARAIIDSFNKFAPKMLISVAAAVHDARVDLGFTHLDPKPWAQAQSISIDYAIMEQAKNLWVMPLLDTGWSDLGGWASVFQQSEADEAGNVTCECSTQIDCSNTLLRSDGANIQLVGIGLQNMIAVATTDAVLVAPMSESQRVGEAVAKLKAKSVHQSESSIREYRPWGWFERLAHGDLFQVKRIFVKSGASLSLQSHKHRAEHWVVVSGNAQVRLRDQQFALSEGQSVYIPKAALHRLENRGHLPLTILEVQLGAYLGEDDILRFEDAYGRAGPDCPH